MRINARKRWVVAVDIGQSIDPTAVAVLEVTSRQDQIEQHYAGVESVGIPSEWYEQTSWGARVRAPESPAFVDVRYLERLKLRSAYVDQVVYVQQLLERWPLTPQNTDLVLDQTGVGRPIVELFQRAGLNPVAVTITSGDSESRVSHREWRVSKLQLVGRLQAMLHAGELRIAKHLADAETLALELQDFRASIGETGYTRFGARNGKHDDLVLALALGTWWAGRPSEHVQVGTYFI